MEKKNKIKGEPKKSTGTDGGQSNSEQDSQTLNEREKRKRKITGSGTVELQS
jgi:hypothetical protein